MPTVFHYGIQSGQGVSVVLLYCLGIVGHDLTKLRECLITQVIVLVVVFMQLLPLLV